MEQGFSVFIYFLKIICEFINLNKSSRAPYIPSRIYILKRGRRKLKQNKKRQSVKIKIKNPSLSCLLSGLLFFLLHSLSL